MDSEIEITFSEVASVFSDGDSPDSVHAERWQEARCDRRASSLYATPELLDLVFRMSRDLGLSRETALLAVDLLLVFLSRHTSQLSAVVFARDRDGEDANARWAALVARVSAQSCLRIVSCIQLAAKATSCAQLVSVTAGRSALRQLGLNYSVPSVHASERRVLSALGCRVPLASSAAFVELLVWRLRDRLSVAELDLVYHAAVRVLQVALMLQQQAFKHLFHMTTRRWCPTTLERVLVREVARDRLFLACAAVSCAGALALGRRWVGAVPALSAAAGLPSADVEGLAGILVRLCVVD